MNVLAIDTTTKTASVSIKKDNALFMDKVENEITHSEKLLPLIDKVLNEANIKISDISTLACINGPGSFTGIRIGLATIKAIAQVNNLDIFSINSLELIAYTTYINKKLSKDSYIISIISTNNDRVFYCIYKLIKKNNKVDIENISTIKNEYIEDFVEDINNFIKKIENNNDVFISGNCINTFKNELLSLNCNKYDFYPTTNDCINIISQIFDTSKYMFNTYTLKANYARKSQAERIKNGEN